MVKIFNDRWQQLPDRIADFYAIKSGADAPAKDIYRMSEVGAFGDVPEFTGSVTYDDVNQGYDSFLTHKEYATGFQVERKLFDDDLFSIIDGKPSGLATAAVRTRQKHGASLYNNAFSLDATWLTHSEAVPLCSNSHTTTATGVSTASGFDNLVTAALSATSATAARIQMRGFRGDRADRISVVPDKIVIPVDLYQVAYEISESSGWPENANNAANVHKGAYKIVDWEYLDDVNNWFMVDSGMEKEAQCWVDRIKQEFGMVEDFDTFIGKWRLYMRYSLGWNNWRHILGAQVS